MQAKMAGRSPALNRLYQWLFAAWVPLFGWSARRLPLAVLYPLGVLVMRVFLILRPKYGRAVRANYSQVLGRRQESREVRALTRQMARHHAWYWIDFFYWSERGDDGARPRIGRVVNREALERCLHSGRGCLMLTAHLGNWEMGAFLLDRGQKEFAVIYVPDRFATMEFFRSAYRRRAGVSEIPLTGDPLSALKALRILRDGGIVAAQGDRDFDDSGIPVTFFGRAAMFPKGPAVLSLLSGCPILPVFILRGHEPGRGGPGSFDIVVSDPIEPRGGPRDPAAVASLVSAAVHVIEAMIRQHPEQWYCFYPFWAPLTGDQRGRNATTAAT